MKILGISASPRKNRSNTFALLKEILSIATKENFQTEEAHLSAYAGDHGLGRGGMRNSG